MIRAKNGVLLVLVLGLSLIILIIVQATNTNDLNNGALLNLIPSINISQGNSTNPQLGEPTGSSVKFITSNFQLGGASIYFTEGATSHIKFTNQSHFNSTNNFTVTIWANDSVGAGAGDELVGTRTSGGGDGEWFTSIITVNRLKATYAGTSTVAVTETIDAQSGTWFMMAFRYTFDVPGGLNISIFLNDTYLGASTGAVGYTSVDRDVLIGFNGFDEANNIGFNGIVIHNTSLSDANISHMYHNGSAALALGPEEEPPPPPGLEVFTVTANDQYDGVAMTNITLRIFNNSFSFNTSTENGTIILLNRSIPVFDTNYNITVGSNDTGGYFNNTFFNINLTDSGSLVTTMFQSIVRVNASKVILGTAITDFFTAIPLQTNQSNGFATLLVRKGNYNITGNKTGFVNVTLEISIGAQENTTFTLEFGTAELKINATSKLTGITITSFTSNITSLTNTFIRGKTTTTGEIKFVIINGTYNVTFDGGSTFAGSNRTITVTEADRFPNITFSVFTFNSVNFTILDEIIGRQRNFFNGTPVFIDFVSTVFADNFSTNNGSLFLDLLAPADYRVTYSSAGFGKRDFFFTLVNKTHNDIELYLLSIPNATDVTFTVQDNSGEGLEDALIQMKRYYVDTNSFRTVAMAKTNAEGKAIIDTHFNNAFYETFTTFQEFSLRTIGTKFISTTFIITMNLLPDPFQAIDAIQNIISTLTFNNVTETFLYTFSNTAGTSAKGTLIVTKFEPDKQNIECETTDTSTGATLLCTVNVTNSTGRFVAQGFIDIGGENVLDKTLEIIEGFTTAAKAVFGTQGVFMSIMIAGAMAGLGAFAGPAMATIFFLAGLGSTIFFGFSLMAVSLYVAIAIMGFIIIYKTKT